MDKYVKLVESAKQEQELFEALSLADKVISVIYRDPGSFSHRGGVGHMILGAIGKLIPREDFEKDVINVNTKYGDKMVKDVLLTHDKGMPSVDRQVTKIRNMVRKIISKLVAKSIKSGKLDDKTAPSDENYYGWQRWIHDDAEWKNIFKQAKPLIFKELKLMKWGL